MKYEFKIRGQEQILKLEKGKQYKVEVRGYIMCKGVESGFYRVKIGEHNGIPTATFYKPKGKKVIAVHYIESIMLMSSFCKDCNGTVVADYYKGKL